MENEQNDKLEQRIAALGRAVAGQQSAIEVLAEARDVDCKRTTALYGLLRELSAALVGKELDPEAIEHAQGEIRALERLFREEGGANGSV